jgi:D-glycero-D-manno-heptose 1,7-bisphosphate phosphatase
MGIGAVKNLQRAIFLDRDGVLNRSVIKNNKPYPPASLQELEVPADVAPALQTLKAAGFLTIVVTNQPDVARGTTTRTVVESINQTLADILPLDDFFVCYHDDADQCNCRKPLPGLLLQAAEQYRINLATSFMVGDRWKDIEAGQRAGCQTIWIDGGYAEKAPEKPPTFKTNLLSSAAAWILNHS